MSGMAVAAQTIPMRYGGRFRGDFWELQINTPNFDDSIGTGGHTISSLRPIAANAFIGARQVLGGIASSVEGFTQVFEVFDFVRDESPSALFAFAPITADHDAVVDWISEVGAMRAQVDARLGALSTLHAGWLDGEGVAPSVTALDHARSVIPHLLNLSVPRPRIAATPEGGVEAEWSIGDREVSVTFEPDGSLYGMAVDVVTHAVTEPELHLADRGAIAAFVLGPE